MNGGGDIVGKRRRGEDVLFPALTNSYSNELRRLMVDETHREGNEGAVSGSGSEAGDV